MMKQTKFSVLSIAIAAALTIPAVINADSAEVTPTESNPSIVTPVTSPDGNKWSGNVNSTSTSASSAFVVPSGFGNVKLHFHNVGKGAVTVTVNSTGLEYVSVTIDPGAEYTWKSTTNYPQGMRAGSYSVSYHSSTAAVSVDYSGCASDSVTKELH
ncbi:MULTISPECIES: hypothetical protein [unclassified Paenibacillus]|uniref:hypothetical protein n=1 Tax=unclassified Paenibacillus TaxID=185978 RepID=UPI00104E7E9D|nr:MULTISPECIES: hypothetical protein [unclassified Paenibacillus]NIK72486.1 hypothetical protein [Paenibacillus sp. BK720]TCM90654.1 hypothetical protein EV294_1105 [Paenibacillus sp. BK033]